MREKLANICIAAYFLPDQLTIGFRERRGEELVGTFTYSI